MRRGTVRTLVAAVISCLSYGCAPSRPATFDYAPEWVSPSMPCSLARSTIETTFLAFHDGEPPLQRYSECSAFFAAVMRYTVPENGCAGDPRDQAMLEEYIGSRGQEFKQWIKPCGKIIEDANTYAAAMKDYTAKEQSNTLSWRDAFILFLISSAH